MTLKHGCCLAFLAMGLSLGVAAWAESPLRPIASLDVARYMGTWHEVARYPNMFQRRCAADTSARYTLLPSGRVEVLNRCRSAEGDMIEALGEARQVGAADSPNSTCVSHRPG